MSGRYEEPKRNWRWRSRAGRAFTRRWPVALPDRQSLQRVVTELDVVSIYEYPDGQHATVDLTILAGGRTIESIDDLMDEPWRNLHKVELLMNGYEVTFSSGWGAKTRVVGPYWQDTVNVAVLENITSHIDAASIALKPWHLFKKTAVINRADRDLVEQRKTEARIQRWAGFWGALGGAVTTLALGAVGKAFGWLN